MIFAVVYNIFLNADVKIPSITFSTIAVLISFIYIEHMGP